MKDKKWRRLGAALLSLLFLAAGCGKRGADSSGTTGSGTTSAGGSNTAAADTMDVDFSSRDMDVGYNEAESTFITFGSGGIVTTGGGASARRQHRYHHWRRHLHSQRHAGPTAASS